MKMNLRGSSSFTFQWVLLDKHVLLVDVKSGLTSFDAYIGAVVGRNYDEEALGVVVNGSVVWNSLAEVYFGRRKGRVTSLFQKEPYSGGSPRPTLQTPLGPDILGTCYLDEHVAVVAKGYQDGTWAAYVGAVKGEDYGKEADEVVSMGSKISFAMSEVCFSDLAKSTEVKGEKWILES